MASYNKRISDQSKVKFNPINRELEDSENSELDSRVDNLEENILDSKTATGNPITITDAAPVNALNLSVDLEPVQDLHGYDHPWVGGAGKNKSSINDCNASAFTDLRTQPISIGSERNYTISMKLMRINGVTVDNSYLYAFRVNEYDSTDTIINVISSNVQHLPDNIEVSFSQTVTLDPNTAYIIINYGNFNSDSNINTHKYDIQAEEGSTATSFTPYSNICPISGRSEVAINRVSGEVTDTYTIQLGDTVYGGTLNVTRGKMVVDRGYIASYNGETLPSSWISDRDVYASGTTPTIGAQVVYELATPITIDLTPQQIKLLENTNTLYTDYEGDTITIEYRLNNTIGEILGEVEDIYNKIDDIYNKIKSLDTRVTALEES